MTSNQLPTGSADGDKKQESYSSCSSSSPPKCATAETAASASALASSSSSNNSAEKEKDGEAAQVAAAASMAEKQRAAAAAAAAISEGVSPFLTTTDVIQKLNQSLQELEDQEESVVHNNNINTNAVKPRFELQRMLPDGSSRRATPSEQKAADCETKLKQVADHVASLKSWKEKLDWVECQRRYGNQLYQAGSYAPAIDVYLTCLTVVAVPAKESETAATAASQQPQPQQQQQVMVDTPHKEKGGNDDDYLSSKPAEPIPHDAVLLLFCKVMNNLALSALQLKWYHKSEQFCTMAVDHWQQQRNRIMEIKKKGGIIAEQQHPKEQMVVSTSDECLQLSKLYFQRGKARRLRGIYKTARSDLDQALRWIDEVENCNKIGSSTCSKNSNGNHDDAPDDLKARRKAVQREQQLVEKAAAEGQRNKRRLNKSMKKILGTNGNISGNKNEPKASRSSSSFVAGASVGETDGNTNDSLPKRTYSTLRDPSSARKQSPGEGSCSNISSKKREGGDDDDEEQPMYPFSSTWHYYRLVVARLAQRLLEWLGDDEETEDDGGGEPPQPSPQQPQPRLLSNFNGAPPHKNQMPSGGETFFEFRQRRSKKEK